MIFETFLPPLIFSRATIGRLGNHYFPVMYVGAARKVFPNWSQKKKKKLFMITSCCFTVMVSNQLAFRVTFLKDSKLLAYFVLENGASWASGLLFRAHVVPACKPVFFNYNFHEKTKGLYQNKAKLGLALH